MFLENQKSNYCQKIISFVQDHACFDDDKVVSAHAVYLRIKMQKDGVKFNDHQWHDCTRLCNEIAQIDFVRRNYWTAMAAECEERSEKETVVE